METIDDQLVIRLPRGALMALERAAIYAHLPPGEMARRLLLDGLDASGFQVARATSRGGDLGTEGG